jgi:hypothetical protein
MNTVHFDDDDNPGLYMDFVYTETLANTKALLKKAKNTFEISNSQYSTFAFDNYRRIKVILKTPYTDKKEGEYYVLESP